MDKREWWRQTMDSPNAEEIFRNEGDGQSFLAAFKRQTEDGTEYAVLLCSDGDYTDKVFGGVLLCNGHAVEIPSD